MKIEDVIMDIHEKVHETRTDVEVIKKSVEDLKENHNEDHKDLQRVKTDVNKAKGAVKLIVLVAVVLGILVSLGKLL